MDAERAQPTDFDQHDDDVTGTVLDPHDGGEGEITLDDAASSDAALHDAAPMEESGPIDGATGAGAQLRAAREAQGVELSHVAGETRIPIRHLASIEAGEYDALPSRTYAIGFAKSYARAVGLAPADIAERVRAELATGERNRVRDRDAMEPGDPAKLPSAGLAWFGGIAALLLAVGGFAFYSAYYGAGTGLAPLMADSENVGDAAGPVADANPGAATGAAPSSDGRVIFTAVGDGVWVRFYENGGERLFEDLLESGESFEVPSDANAPLINTGRPDLLEITIDGQPVPKLAEEPTTMGDVPISAKALLARADTSAAPRTAVN